jgi:hypothetical protein
MSDFKMDDHAGQLQEGTPTMAGATASCGGADENNDGDTRRSRILGAGVYGRACPSGFKGSLEEGAVSIWHASG